MTIDSDKILHDLLNSLDSLEGIRPGEIPNIALYMDQVTTFMDAQLASSRRFESDKVLTKTMINNYAKNKLLPPPVKKKYSPEHMMLLVFIYYFKNILSITDIQTLLAPITDRYFGTESGFSIKDIYDEIFQMEKEEIASVKEDLLKKSGCIQVHVRQLTGGGPGISPALFVYLSAEFRCLSEKTDARAHGG
jgi:DNA-binding transcriptional MerR regulator